MLSVAICSTRVQHEIVTPPSSAKVVAGSQQWARAAGVVFGAPINFRGLRHAPINEQGVVYLFGMVSSELGLIVGAVQAAYPDCEAKRCVDTRQNRWQRVRIEFEFYSSNFREHGHDPTACDMIVCWEHDWPTCPLEVVELRSVIDQLEGGIACSLNMSPIGARLSPALKGESNMSELVERAAGAARLASEEFFLWRAPRRERDAGLLLGCAAVPAGARRSLASISPSKFANVLFARTARPPSGISTYRRSEHSSTAWCSGVWSCSTSYRAGEWCQGNCDREQAAGDRHRLAPEADRVCKGPSTVKAEGQELPETVSTSGPAGPAIPSMLAYTASCAGGRLPSRNSRTFGTTTSRTCCDMGKRWERAEIPFRLELQRDILAFWCKAGIEDDAGDRPPFQKTNQLATRVLSRGRQFATWTRGGSNPRSCRREWHRTRSRLGDDRDLPTRGVPLEDVQYLAGRGRTQREGSTTTGGGRRSPVPLWRGFRFEYHNRKTDDS